MIIVISVKHCSLVTCEMSLWRNYVCNNCNYIWSQLFGDVTTLKIQTDLDYLVICWVQHWQVWLCGFYCFVFSSSPHFLTNILNKLQFQWSVHLCFDYDKFDVSCTLYICLLCTFVLAGSSKIHYEVCVRRSGKLLPCRRIYHIMSVCLATMKINKHGVLQLLQQKPQ